MDTQKLLADSVAGIQRLGAGQCGSDVATTAFTSLRKAVNHATKSRTDSPEALIGDLEPKGDVLRFLSDFYAARRIYRKQVVAVADELLRVNAWRCFLKQDGALCAQLPDEISRMLAESKDQPELQSLSQETQAISQEHVVSKGSRAFPEYVPASTNKSASPWSGERSPSKQRSKDTQRRQRLSAACFLPMRVASGTTLSGTVILTEGELNIVQELLERGRSQIESLGFSAADSDASISAFETFRRAVQQVVNTTSFRQDGNVLESIEPKGRILDFLVDVYERHQKYRSRVTSTLTRLLNLDSWNKAADGEEPPKGSPKAKAPSPLHGSTPFDQASQGRTKKWTPWGVAGSSESSPSGGIARRRNPFASDAAAKQKQHAGYPGAVELWTDAPSPASSSAAPRRRPSLENNWPNEDTPAKAVHARSKAANAPGPWGDRAERARAAKPTNPFGGTFSPAATHASKSAATNPFKKDVRWQDSGPPPWPASSAAVLPAAGVPSPLKAGASKNPFRSDPQVSRKDAQVPSFVTKATW